MHRGIHAGVVVVPLIIGLGFLLFAVFTEYWTSLDFSQIKKYDRNNYNNNASDQIIKYRNKMYFLKRHRIEFPKYTSLFGECNEYKLVEILEPMPESSSKSQDSGSAPANTEPTVSSSSSSSSSLSTTNLINDPVMEASFLKLEQDTCFTREQCQAQLPQQTNSDLNSEFSCFCCSKPSSRQQQQQQQHLEQNTNDEDVEENKLFKKSPLLEQCCYPNSKVKH